MNFYKFVAYGKTVVIREDELDSLDSFADVGAAMAVANSELLWSNPEACEGSWELNETAVDFHTEYTYVWKEISKQPLGSGILWD